MKTRTRKILKIAVISLIICVNLGFNMLQAQVTTTESFETAVPPAGWSSAIGSGTYNWTRATTTGLPNGSYYAYYDSYDADAGNYASLVSSAFDLSSRGSNTPTVSLYFYRGSSYIDYPDYLEVYINTTNSLSGATLLSTGGSSRLYRHYTLAPVAATSGWFQYTFNLPADFNGTSNYIILKAVSGWGYNLCIDQVQIVSYPCVNPTITSTTPASGVGPNTYTLGATASQGTVNWYTAASGGSVIATGTSYNTPNISATTTYYVNATYNVCSSSPRIPVVATIASHYDAGAGIAIAGTTITNTAPDQTVTLSTGTGISVSGTYPNFNISNTAPNQTVTLTGNGATSVSGTYPNFTISSTDNNTTYNAGTGIDISNGSITNIAPDQTVTLTGNGATSVTGTYPNFTISSTDNNTTYTPGTGLSLTGNTLNSVWTTDGNNIVNNNTGTVSIGSLGNNGSSLVKADNTGLLDKITMSGDNTQVLRADGTFGPIVYPPNSYRINSNTLQVLQYVEIGNSITIGGVHDDDPSSINQIFTDDHGQGNFRDLFIQCNPAFQNNTIINKDYGMVGIGARPEYKLDLKGTFRIQGNGAGLGKVLTSGEDGLATWQDPLTYSAGTGLYMTDNTINSVWTNDGELLYNNTASKFGLGTDNPLVNLHLKGITDCQLTIPHLRSSIFRIEDNVINAPLGEQNRNVWWDMIVSGREHKFIFTSNEGTTTKDIITMKETGQIGIGVDEPTESLEVNGAMVLGNTTNANPANGTLKFADNQLKVFAGEWQSFSGLWTAGTGTIYSASTAKIGIGTNNPLVNFHIKGITDGSDEAAPPTPLSAIIRLEDNLINSDNDRDVSWDIIVSASHNKMVFKNNAGLSTFNSVLSIKENGSMGIGVDDPIEKLEVNGHIKMTDGNQRLGNVLISDANGKASWTSPNISFTNNQLSLLGNTFDFSSYLDNTDNQSLSINSATNKLEITNGSSVDLPSFNTTGGISVTGTYPNFTINNLVNDNQQLSITNDQLSISNGNAVTIPNFWTASGNDIFSNNLGNVGIGTSTPRANLAVKDGGTFRVGSWEFKDFSTSNSFYLTRQIWNGTVDVPTNIFAIQQNGSVADMYLSGNLFSTEVHILSTFTWPDYVFAKDYKLSNLNDVEQYITKNNHLPDVPSATEIKENGQNIGEMNAILLKKIEELTLYSIEQNKRIKALENELFKGNKH